LAVNYTNVRLLWRLAAVHHQEDIVGHDEQIYKRHKSTGSQQTLGSGSTAICAADDKNRKKYQGQRFQGRSDWGEQEAAQRRISLMSPSGQCRIRRRKIHRLKHYEKPKQNPQTPCNTYRNRRHG